jgi:hypothetical protein
VEVRPDEDDKKREQHAEKGDDLRGALLSHREAPRFGTTVLPSNDS